MAPELCIYCLAAPAEEGDHVPPRQWYPDGTDPGVQRVTVPSCKPCGAKLKKAEEQMALALMLSVGFDHNHEAAKGVYNRVRSTWKAVDAETPREFKHRRDRLYSIMRRVRPVSASLQEAPGAARVQARTPAGVWVEAAVALQFRREDFDVVIAKFVRGLHWRRTGTALAIDAKITAFNPPGEAMKEAAGLPGGSVSNALFYRVYEDKDAGRTGSFSSGVRYTWRHWSRCQAASRSQRLSTTTRSGQFLARAIAGLEVR